MPPVTLKTGIMDADGHEEVLHEYLCDWPGCTNIAAHVVGFVKESCMSTVVCAIHAALIEARNRNKPADG